MSLAERQRVYSQRYLKEDARKRIDLVVEASTKRKLERLATRFGITQALMLECLVAQAERNIVDTLDEQAGYYDEFTVTNRSGNLIR